MSQLKSRQNFPIGGWQFHQPETGWNSNPYVGFRDVVEGIIQHRNANPRFKLSTNREHVEWELEQFTVARLRGIKGGETYLVQSATSPPPPPNFSMPLRPRKGPAVAGGVKKAKAGVSLMQDWLGDGLKPVEAQEAERRAGICVTCPLNKKAEGVQRVYSAIAHGIGLLVQAKNDLKLSTSHDAELGTCTACDCALELKVHAPLVHILKHTSDEVRAALDPNCWITA